MIVAVRLKPTGVVRWMIQARKYKSVKVKVKCRIETPDFAGIESVARKLGTAAVGFTMCAVTAADGTVIANRPFRPPVFKTDPRIERLKAFFDSYHCPAPRYIGEYLRMADAYHVDYRLLPALSVRESTCGRFEKAYNRWGWKSGDVGFASVQQGIEHVARELAEAPQYKGKTVDQILWTYNPREAYSGEVKKLMEKIGP